MVLKKINKNNKDQILYFSKRCTNYSIIIENLFRFILAEKNSFIFESVEKGKIKEVDIQL